MIKSKFKKGQRVRVIEDDYGMFDSMEGVFVIREVSWNPDDARWEYQVNRPKKHYSFIMFEWELANFNADIIKKRLAVK